MREEWFFLLPLSCALIDAAVATALILGRRGKPPDGVVPAIGIERLTRAALATAVVCLLKLPLLRWLGTNRFGFIHVVYTELTVTIPLIGAAVLLARWRDANGRQRGRATPPARCFAALGCALAPVGVYATFIEPFRLKMESIAVPLAETRTGRRPISVGVLADIQTARVTKYERAAVGRLLDQRPDVILLAGDLFQGSDAAFERELEALRGLVARLSAPGGVYCVLGNIDGRRRIDRVIEGTAVRLLVNEIAGTTVADRRLRIGGLELRCDSDEARRVIDELETASGAGDVRIVLAHLPNAVLGLRRDSRIDLVVAGHTHGGQVSIPLLGPPMTLSAVPRRVGAGGLHEMDGRRIYVSRGVGCERGQAPRLRFLTPPEITLLTLGDGP